MTHQLCEEIEALAEAASDDIVVKLTAPQAEALQVYAFDVAHKTDPFPGRMKGRKLHVARKDAGAALEYLNYASESAGDGGDRAWEKALTNVWRKIAKEHYK